MFAAREILNLFVLQVYQDFDSSKFNFTKANPVETMFWTHIPVQEPRGKEEEEEGKGGDARGRDHSSLDMESPFYEDDERKVKREKKRKTHKLESSRSALFRLPGIYGTGGLLRRRCF